MILKSFTSVLIALMEKWIFGCFFSAILEVLQYNKMLITIVRNWFRDNPAYLGLALKVIRCFCSKCFWVIKNETFFPLLSSRNGLSKALSLWPPFWFFVDKLPDTFWSRTSYSVQMLIIKLVLCLLPYSISVRRN